MISLLATVVFILGLGSKLRLSVSEICLSVLMSVTTSHVRPQSAVYILITLFVIAPFLVRFRESFLSRCAYWFCIIGANLFNLYYFSLS